MAHCSLARRMALLVGTLRQRAAPSVAPSAVHAGAIGRTTESAGGVKAGDAQREAAGEVVALHVQPAQQGELRKPLGNGAAQAVAPDGEDSQLGERRKRGGHCARDLVVGQVQKGQLRQRAERGRDGAKDTDLVQGDQRRNSAEAA